MEILIKVMTVIGLVIYGIQLLLFLVFFVIGAFGGAQNRGDITSFATDTLLPVIYLSLVLAFIERVNTNGPQD